MINITNYNGLRKTALFLFLGIVLVLNVEAQTESFEASTVRRQNSALVCDVLGRQGFAFPACGGARVSCEFQTRHREIRVRGRFVGTELHPVVRIDGQENYARPGEIEFVEFIAALGDLGCRFTRLACVVVSRGFGATVDLNGYTVGYVGANRPSNTHYQDPAGAQRTAYAIAENLRSARVCERIEN